ncbi:MAG: hypothetical protein DMG65_19485 [Candidatus Angelobacter sp. Gp1-AA117]|nr:MAG: hypothetical protein DMG65_19485 [Candidatus Angelobacter sp. Gp1-AA117]
MPQKASAKTVIRRPDSSDTQKNNIHLRSEEDCLRVELEELDNKDPQWYQPNLIRRARQLLEAGKKREAVMAIYGEKVTEEAQKQNQKKPSAESARTASASSKASG